MRIDGDVPASTIRRTRAALDAALRDALTPEQLADLQANVDRGAVRWPMSVTHDVEGNVVLSALLVVDGEVVHAFNLDAGPLGITIVGGEAIAIDLGDAA